MPDELPDRSEVSKFDHSKLKHVNVTEKVILPSKEGKPRSGFFFFSVMYCCVEWDLSPRVISTSNPTKVLVSGSLLCSYSSVPLKTMGNKDKWLYSQVIFILVVVNIVCFYVFRYRRGSCWFQSWGEVIRPFKIKTCWNTREGHITWGWRFVFLGLQSQTTVVGKVVQLNSSPF